VNAFTLTAGSPSSDLAAAELAAKGVPLPQICAKFDPVLSPQAARAAIQRGQHALDRQRPKPIPAPRPAPPAVAVPAKPRATVPLDADELLAWAEKEGNTRASKLAARVRAQLAELGALHERNAQTAELRRFIAVLEKQAADAKAELRRITSGTAPAPSDSSLPAPAAPEQEKEERARIREWARANGHQVADRGFIKAAVVAAYRAANPGGEAT